MQVDRLKSSYLITFVLGRGSISIQIEILSELYVGKITVPLNLKFRTIGQVLISLLTELKWSWSHSSLSFTIILITISPLATMSSYHDQHQQKTLSISHSQFLSQSQPLLCTLGLFTTGVTMPQADFSRGLHSLLTKTYPQAYFSSTPLDYMCI